MDDAILQKYCRVCTNRKTHMISIFERYDFSQCNLQVFEVITKCASVQIRRLDGFPEQICNECLEHLRQAFSFKKLCEDSDYKFQHNLVFGESIVSKDAYCEEVTKDRHDNDNIFNEELDCASSDDGFRIESGNQLDEENFMSATDSTVQNLKGELLQRTPTILSNEKSPIQHIIAILDDVSEDSNNCSTKVKDEINGYDGKEVVTNADRLEVKLEFYEEDTKINYGDLAILHVANSKTSSTSLNDELSACLSRSNSDEIIEDGVTDKHLQKGDNGKSSTDSTTDVNNELSAKTKPISNVKKSLTHFNRSHNLNDNLGETTPTIIPNENSHKCTFFRRCFNETAIFNNHGEIHKEKECYKCKICGKYYTCKAAIIRLGNPIDTEKKSHKCEKCNKSFGFKKNLQRHIKIHLEDKPYKCEICDKKFRSRETLVRHIRIHTGCKPYKCEICNRSFTLKNNLNRHIKIHSKGNAGWKLYKCEMCNRSFRVKNNLSRHLKIHGKDNAECKLYKCEICNRSFSVKGNLNRHINTHSKDRPYNCEICHKNFRLKQALVRHTRQVHTGCKPYKCEICNSSYSRKSSLDTHIDSHFQPKPSK